MNAHFVEYSCSGLLHSRAQQTSPVKCLTVNIFHFENLRSLLQLLNSAMEAQKQPIDTINGLPGSNQTLFMDNRIFMS